MFNYFEELLKYLLLSNYRKQIVVNITMTSYNIGSNNSNIGNIGSNSSSNNGNSGNNNGNNSGNKTNNISHYSPIKNHYQRNNDVSTKKKISLSGSPSKFNSELSRESTVVEETSVTDKDTNSFNKSQLNSTNSNIVKRLVIDLSADSDVGEECYITEIIPNQVLIDLTNDDSNSDSDNKKKTNRSKNAIQNC